MICHMSVDLKKIAIAEHPVWLSESKNVTVHCHAASHALVPFNLHCTCPCNCNSSISAAAAGAAEAAAAALAQCPPSSGPPAGTQLIGNNPSREDPMAVSRPESVWTRRAGPPAARPGGHLEPSGHGQGVTGTRYPGARSEIFKLSLNGTGNRHLSTVRVTSPARACKILR